MKWLPLLMLLVTPVFAASPTSNNNDDTCDVKVGPAATLLLPYFEVDVSGTSGQTTLFTITNVTRYPQVAHVTIWTDWAYPVLTFNLFLTGYDVQAINVADILVRGIVAPPSGTTSAAQRGSLSVATNGNLLTSLDCGNNPGLLPQSLAQSIRTALTRGTFSLSSCTDIGGTHANAVGYATIDVVAGCTTRSPVDPLYYTNDLLFDNVLIGDYQQVGPHAAAEVGSGLDGAGNPLVHLRAVPEGGNVGSNVATGLPYTFYDRYTPAATRALDRRQPLPSTFAARFISGGNNAFATNLTIWREGFGTGSCADAKASAAMTMSEIVRFDEHENVFTQAPPLACTCFTTPPTLPASSSTASSGSVYPLLVSPEIAGWLYLNLNNGGSTTYSVTRDVGGVRTPTNGRTSLAPAGSGTNGPRPSQNWVTTTMFGSGVNGNRMTAEFDAPSLGNGCTPAAFLSPADGGTAPIGPGGGLFVCPPGTTLTDGSTALCAGTNGNPIP